MNAYSRALAPIINKATPKPKFELTEDQIRRLSSAANILLTIIGVAGLLLVSVAAPNALKAFSFLGRGEQRGRVPFVERRKKLTRSFYYLKSHGYLELHRKKNDFEIKLTEKGRRKLDKLRLEVLQVKKPLFWNDKFWQVAADIPVKYRKGADAFRNKLKQMGFYSLQRTLWFYPYDPRKEISLLTEEYKIERFVTVMKIASFDYADYKVLREFFKETGVIEI